MINPAAPRDLELKKTAQIYPLKARSHRTPVPRRPAPGQHVETIIGDGPAIGREVRRLMRASLLVDTGRRHVVQSGPHAGLLELRVIVKDPAPSRRWVKMCAGTGLVLAPTLALGLGTWWLLTALSAVSIVGWAAIVLVVLALLAWKGRASEGGGGRGVHVTVTTSVHVR